MTKKQSSHSRYAASAASIWTECPGSVDFVAELRAAGKLQDDEPGDAAELGTLLHRVAEDTIRNETCVTDELDRILSTDKHLRRHKTEAEQMTTGIHEYVKFVEEQVGDEGELELEVRYTNPDNTLGGTSDAVILSPGRLHIIDLKTGRGIVDADNNRQLMLYAAFALKAMGKDARHVKTVAMTIFQPRFYPYESTFECKPAKILAFLKDVVIPAVALDHLNAGSHCQWCPARPRCRAWVEHNVKRLEELGEPIMPDKKAITKQMKQVVEDDNNLPVWFEILKSAAAAFDDLKKTIGDEHDNLPHLQQQFTKTEYPRTTRVWNDDPAIAKTLMKDVGADAVEPLSPSKLEKKFGDNPAISKLFAKHGEERVTIVRTIKVKKS